MAVPSWNDSYPLFCLKRCYFKDWSLHVTTYQDNKSLSITSLIIEITSPIFDTKVNPRALKFYCQPSKENPVLPNFVISRDYNLLVIFMTGNLLFHTYQDLHMEKEPAHVVHNQPIRKANDFSIMKEQIDSMFPWVWSVMDQMWILTSSMINYCTGARQHGIYL